MKNNIISMLIFILMIIVIFFSINYINKVSDNLISLADEMEVYIVDNHWEKAYDHSLIIFEEWKHHHQIIALHVNDVDIDIISSKIIEQMLYTKHKNKSQSLAALHVIKYGFMQIKEFQKISLHNIF